MTAMKADAKAEYDALKTASDSALATQRTANDTKRGALETEKAGYVTELATAEAAYNDLMAQALDTSDSAAKGNLET